MLGDTNGDFKRKLLGKTEEKVRGYRSVALSHYCGNGYAFCVMISRKLGLDELRSRSSPCKKSYLRDVLVLEKRMLPSLSVTVPLYGMQHPQPLAATVGEGTQAIPKPVRPKKPNTEGACGVDAHDSTGSTTGTRPEHAW